MVQLAFHIEIPVIELVRMLSLGLRQLTPCWSFAVEKQKVMLGTFSPQQEPYMYEAEEDTTPSGIFARGSYSAKLKVRKPPK